MSKAGETIPGDHYRITQADIDKAKLREAIEVTQYKYFGDYEFSTEQAEAVETLVDFARAALAASEPRKPWYTGDPDGE